MNNKRQRSKLFTMLLLVMALIIPQWGWAQEASKPSVGDGSEENPFQISSAEELSWFRNWVNGKNTSTSHSSACAILIKDIDMKDITWDETIGDYYKKIFYSGVFDGKNKTISNLNIQISTDFAGLFAYGESATIKNIGLNKVNVKTTKAGAGILVGEIHSCTISCIKISNSTVTSGGRYAGAITGCSFSSKISNCDISATVFGNDVLGGLVGEFYNENEIRNIFLSCQVSTPIGDVSGSGPLIGAIDSDSNVKCSGIVAYNKEATNQTNKVDGIGLGEIAAGFIL